MRSFGTAFGRVGASIAYTKEKSRPVGAALLCARRSTYYFVCATTHFANAFGRVPYVLLKLVGVVLRMLRQVFDAVVNEALSFVVAVPSFCATQLPNALLRSVFVP